MSNMSTGTARLADLLPVPQIKESHNLKIDPQVAGTTVTVIAPPYQAMRENDRVKLTFAPLSGGTAWSNTRTVSPNEIGKPLKWNLPRAELLKIEGEAADISYVIDYASGGQSASATQTIEIIPPDTALLSPARILNHQGGPLDPGLFPLGAVVVLDAYPGIALDDHVAIYWTGPQDAGSTIGVLRVDPSVIDRGVLELMIGREWLDANIGRQVEVAWQYARTGAAESAQALKLDIRMPLNLRPPIVEKATSDGNLEASNTLSGVFANIPPSVPLGEGDVAELHWQGHPHGGHHVATEPADANNPRRFFVPASAIAANMGGEGKRFPVFYRLTPAGETAQDSEPFNLRILPLSPIRYPIVQCREAEGKPGLPLADVPPEGAEIYVNRWPFMATGQACIIRVSGVSASGAAVDFIVRDSLPVSQAEVDAGVIGGRLPRNFLQGLRTGVAFSLWSSVSFDRDTYTDFQRGAVSWLG